MRPWRPGRALACGAGLAVLALGVVLNQSAVHWRENIVDSDLFAYYGWCVEQGARPYLDVWDNKPPGIWWLNAAALRLCGPGVGSDLLLGSAALVVTLLAFVGAARAAYHRSLLAPAVLVAVVLLTHLTFECGGNRTETFVVACETTAVAAYLRWRRRQRGGWLILAGLAAGAAPWFKQSGAAVAVAVALHLAWAQWRTRRWRAAWRPWALLGGGLLVPQCAAAAALASQGALAAAAYAVGGFNQAYFAAGDATWVRLDRVLRVYAPLLELLAGVLALAGGGLICALWPRGGRVRPSAPPRRGVGLFWIWFLLAFYLACVGPGRRGHHLMPALPALGLLALYPLHALAGRRGLWARVTARPSVACVVVLVASVLGGVAWASLVEARRCWHAKTHWCALQRAVPSPCELQGAEIARRTTPDQTIYVWGWSPGTYRYALRRAASRYATLEKRGQVGEWARFILDGVEADLQRAPPALFIISTGDLAALRAAAAESGFARWVCAAYEPVAHVAGMELLRRRGDLDKSARDR